MADVAYIPGEAGRERRPLVGYAMVTAAALLFAVNGTVSKVVLSSGISSLELTQVRATGAFLGFALALGIVRSRSLRSCTSRCAGASGWRSRWPWSGSPSSSRCGEGSRWTASAWRRHSPRRSRTRSTC